MKFRRALKVLAILLALEGPASAINMTAQVGNLGIAAQACLASAFWDCSCVMLDFQCGCTCKKFNPDVNSCILDSCSPMQQKQALNLFSSTCATATIITTSSTTKLSSATSSKASSAVSQSSKNSTPTETSTNIIIISQSNKGTSSLVSTSSVSNLQTVTTGKVAPTLSSNSKASGSVTSTIRQTGTTASANTKPSIKGSTISTSSVNTNSGTGVLSSTSSTDTAGGIFHATSSGPNTMPTSSPAWGQYPGNSSFGTGTACWQVTVTGTARTTCAIQANPFQGSAKEMNAMSALVLLTWSVGILIVLQIMN